MTVPPRSPNASLHSRRGLVQIAMGGLAALARPGTGAPRRKRRKKPRFRTITRTFANPSPITIDDNGPADLYPSPIQVSGFKDGKVLDVNVTVRRLSHEFPQEIDLLLVAPNGRQAMIMSDTGGDEFVETATDVTLILDDQAGAHLPQLTRLGSGRFKPTNFDTFPPDNFSPPAPAPVTAKAKLATFAGINPNGRWRLFVFDRDTLTFGFTGRIEGGWSLTIRARVRA